MIHAGCFSGLLCGLFPHHWLLSLSVQFEDSEEDFDSRFDTDDELSYRRDSVYSCVTLPYFHSFLYMKGMTAAAMESGLAGERGAILSGLMDGDGK